MGFVVQAHLSFFGIKVKITKRSCLGIILNRLANSCHVNVNNRCIKVS